MDRGCRKMGMHAREQGGGGGNIQARPVQV